MRFLLQVEHSRFSEWVSHSGSIWAFPTILLLHTYGMAVLVGLVAAVDLRILGFAPALPISPLRRLFPIMWIAFWLNAASGTILLAADASSKVTNPDFGVKMLFIALAAFTLRRTETRVFDAQTVASRVFTPDAKRLAAISMISWLGAITAGRLLAYVH